jgi:F0F1-type ATP synthase gamma subunit
MKKIRFTFVVTFLLIAIVHTAGCGSRSDDRAIPADFDYGHWTDSTYQNDFFGFSITVPEDWIIVGKEDVETASQRGHEILGTSEETRKQIKAAEIANAVLFVVAHYTAEEAETKEVFNTNVVMSVDNLSMLGITREQYMESIRQETVKAIPSAVIKSETNTTIGGMEFTSWKLELDVDGNSVFIEMLICLKNDFTLTFCLTWTDNSEKEQLDDIMATLKWK